MTAGKPGPAGGGVTKPVALALQGGGAHGAFGWGVLDRLLEDGRLAVEGISATSAGAMNAVVLSYGLLRGGPEGARAALQGFWQDVSGFADFFNPFRGTPWQNGLAQYSLDGSPAYWMADMMLRVLSPYQFNPLNLNPLRDILERHVDFAELRARCPVHLHLCATNVETGKVRIFSSEEMRVEAVLASACLPTLFQAVEIDGEHFWDGGYMGNPAIFPLIYHCATRDVVIVHINPIVRHGVPRTAREILDRVNEVSFNSSLMREMRAIAFVTSLIAEGRIEAGRMKEMLIHSIRSDETLCAFDVSSKMNADWEFLSLLRDKGRAEAQKWLETSYDNVGVRSSVDVRKEFL